MKIKDSKKKHKERLKRYALARKMFDRGYDTIEKEYRQARDDLDAKKERQYKELRKSTNIERVSKDMKAHCHVCGSSNIYRNFHLDLSACYGCYEPSFY